MQNHFDIDFSGRNPLSNDYYFLTLQRKRREGAFQSGQMGQTVKLLSFDFGGSNPSAPTKSFGHYQQEVLSDFSY